MVWPIMMTKLSVGIKKSGYSYLPHGDSENWRQARLSHNVFFCFMARPRWISSVFGLAESLVAKQFFLNKATMHSSRGALMAIALMAMLGLAWSFDAPLLMWSGSKCVSRIFWFRAFHRQHWSFPGDASWINTIDYRNQYAITMKNAIYGLQTDLFGVFHVFYRFPPQIAVISPERM